MALSKPLTERINKINLDRNVSISLNEETVLEVCKITYSRAISIEIIEHLFGGQNMEFVPMELQDSIDCFAFCRHHLLSDIKNNSKEILFFEDRSSKTNNILIVAVKQLKTNTQREHVVLKSVLRVTVMVEPKVGICRYLDITVRKPKIAKTIQDQLEMVTKNLFQIVKNSAENVKRMLLDGGYVLYMKFPGHKWKFTTGGPREPRFYVPSTPNASPKSSLSGDLFPEDLSGIDESDEDTGETRSLADKVSKKRRAQPNTRPFKFCKFDEEMLKQDSPTSSPILLPSPEVYIISSDEELESSMIELEKKISLEMDSDTD